MERCTERDRLTARHRYTEIGRDRCTKRHRRTDRYRYNEVAVTDRQAWTDKERRALSICPANLQT